MRIAFIGSEAFASVVFALHAEGHAITHVFSPGVTRLPVPIRWDTIERDCRLKVRRQSVGRPELEHLHRAGVDVILCAGYPRRLAVRPEDPVPAVNLHPSPLPEGRGPSPFEWAILSGRETTAVTAHEMVERFDSGPILLQRPVEMSPRETTSSLQMRCPGITADLVVELMNDFPALWEDRRPQGKGSYCRVPRREQRTLDLSGSVVQLDRVLRAFQPGGVYLQSNGKDWVVFDAVCWPERHGHVPGSVVAVNGSSRLMAASDGFLLLRSALPEWAARLRFASARLTRFAR